MRIHSNILGIDVGSVSVSVAEINPEKEVIKTAYEFHHGNIAENLAKILDTFNLSRICGIASTTSTPSILKVNRQYDNQVSIIAGTQHFHNKIGTVLIVGGEKFGALFFDEHGNYRKYKANTSCAAGTGSFLDQQAKRLNITGIEELSDIAFNNRDAVPKIASRCAVFAKTDLVHAQQQGYTLEEICDGLCCGLAKNIADTLFSGEEPNAPIIFTGGVSKNRAVVRHLQSIIRKKIITDETSLYGAIGAGLNLLDELHLQPLMQINSADDILIHKISDRKYFYDPLELKLSVYPDFIGVEKYEYKGTEVDIYKSPDTSQKYNVYLGIDIGSTSTKAVLTDKDNSVLAGFYTRTSGSPVQAVQNIFATIDNLVQTKKINLQIIGAGTTGSGRKFIGKLINSDIAVDEITAHARAACELNPDVDTIIEIGGQDSKFTTLRNGMVTFSVMNTVCAAGTGSFIEEQAQKLGCPLSDYSTKTANQRSPITSDRCTVFMERDINHCLSEGYSVNEALASVLHSVRDNYLSKVAIMNSIGNTIFFQGATAKIKPLVAAFEQKLEKPVYVSEFCHLTGALGTALLLSDQDISNTKFRGIEIHKKQIPIQSEVCELCTNHCKLTIADIEKERVAYGFLCGRDYDTRKHVQNNTSGFDLLRQRKKAFSFKPAGNGQPSDTKQPTIGIPAGLHIYEHLPFWKKFFDELSIKTITSEQYNEAIKQGKYLAGAEFCAPMIALHGHVKYLIDKSDYIFAPVYLENKTKEKDIRRQYCYYTQYSSSLVSAADDGNKFLMPLVSYLYTCFHTKVQLYNMLKTVTKNHISFFDVSAAYDAALEFRSSCSSELKQLYKTESQETDDMHVVFLGRPYTILSKSMNKGIPDIFASLGIKTFFQDMLSYEKKDVKSIEPLLNEIHWHYASEILAAAEVIAQSREAYPVFVTSFKCTPDSFVTEYFKKIMESHDKPYLILQLDEHDSSVGYETRIEAAIRSFRNHHACEISKTSEVFADKPVKHAPSLIPIKEKYLWDKTLLIPNWDKITQKLIIANLRKQGIDARLLEENETSIQKSMRHNTGQCIPLNIIAQGFIDYIETHNLDPSKTVLWNCESYLACSLRLFPYHTKNLLHSYGNGMEKAGVYTGALSFMDISVKLPIDAYFAYMFGGLVRKMGCKIRPYEKNKGETDRVISKSVDVLVKAFSSDSGSKESAVAEVVSYFESIPTTNGQRKPKAAIFGDLYARDNETINQGLIHFIEDNGGEVVTTPYTDYARMIARPYFRKWFFEGLYFNILSTKAFMTVATRMEKTYYKYFERVLKEPEYEYDESPEKILSGYNVRIENTGESMDNLLKIYYIVKHHPDISLFVQTNPAFCCPSLVTEAMSKDIEKVTGIPVVSVTYDGTGGVKNNVIIPYLKYPRTGSYDREYRKLA
ncbi:MAG: CoA activase [Desulfobacterales bacterium]|nr:CoA activase [Desulfobacterales bacterium]